MTLDLNHMLGLLLTGIGIGIAIGGIWMDWYLWRKWKPTGGAEAKLWRISQAVKLQQQNDLAGLQQFYDYVKGVLGQT